MKKIIVFLILCLLCGCSNDNLIESDYINTHSYTEIYNDLSEISRNVSYFPTKENEREFYQMIEVIRDNCDRFTTDEITNLYNLIDNNYEFKYNLDEYNNADYSTDLQTIRKYITE